MEDGLPHKIQNGNGPSAMVERFGSMPVHNAGLFVIRRLNVSTADFKTDSPSPSIRSQIHCFIFVQKGETLISIGDESYLFKANECAVIPAGQLFSVRYYNNCVGFMGGFHPHFMDSDADGKNILYSFEFLRKWGNHKVFFDERQSQYVANIFERLLAENQQEKSKDVIKVYLNALLVELDETYRKQHLSASDLKVNNDLCNRFIESVFQHSDQRISISHYADELNVTPAHLHKIVKRFTGKTPLAWIHEAVVLEAKVILSHTEIPVSEAAAKVGIQDPSYFARLFKKQVGMTPVDFRNRMKYPQKS